MNFDPPPVNPAAASPRVSPHLKKMRMDAAKRYVPGGAGYEEAHKLLWAQWTQPPRRSATAKRKAHALKSQSNMWEDLPAYDVLSGFRLLHNVLDDHAVFQLRSITVTAQNTVGINGEIDRRSLDVGLDRRAAPAIQQILQSVHRELGDQFDVSDFNILMCTTGAERQAPHRDYSTKVDGNSSYALIAAFRPNTYLWIAPDSLLPESRKMAPSHFELRKLQIPVGSVLLFNGTVVHAGGDKTCGPRLHAYVRKRSVRSTGPKLPKRGDFA